MKILLLTEYFPGSPFSNITGGVESRCYNLATRLAKRNKIIVITSWRKGLKRIDSYNKITIFRVGPNHEYSNTGGFISRFRFAQAAAKKGYTLDIDIVDGYNFTTYLPAYLIARKLKKPFVATYHETWVGDWINNKGIATGLPYEVFERIILKLKFNKIISVSNFTKKRLIDRGVRANINVVPNGVDLKKLKLIKVNKAKNPTICYIGRLVETKRVDLLIRALAIVKKKIPHIKCKIIGQGKNSEKLKLLANELKVSDDIDFLGFVENNQELMKILKSSHVFCFPSILEGFGIVLLEAMALGIPYVCSDIDVLKEVTEKGKGGLLFRHGDYIDLADKLSLLFDRQMLKNKIREGYKLVSKYDWDIIAKKTEREYCDIVMQKQFI